MSHGHVTPNLDGSLARCGGPAICAQCAQEAHNAAPALQSWEEFELSLRTLPVTWIPAALRMLVEEAENKKVFVLGGLERFVKGVINL